VRGRLLGVALLVPALSCGWPGGGERVAPARHLLLVTLDTTRADRLGCYGRAGAGTPWLDALAARGTRFERAYAQVPLTLPSHVCILTGLFPARTGVHSNGQTAMAPGARSLASILAGQGFFTAAAVGGYPVAARFPVRAGFDAFDDRMSDPRNPAGLERDAGEVAAAGLRLAGSRSGKRLFLWVQFFDPHDPYDPPPPFRERYSSDPYQGEIARVDAALAELVPALERSLAGETILVCVVGDHGEGLGEHGEDTHGFFIYEPTVRVPLILAGARVAQGRILPGPAQTVDLVPTLLGLLDLPVPQGLDGVRLDLTGGGGPAPNVYLETELPLRNYGWSPLHGGVSGSVKLIQAPRPEMYDLAEDPAESRNLAGTSGADGAGPLASWIEKARRTGAHGGPEADLSPLDTRLMSLGYVGPGSGGPSAPSGERADPKDRIGVYRRFESASRALERGEPSVALPLLDQLIQENDAPGLRFKRAMALRMSGRFDEASRELDRLASVEPEFPGLHLERAIIALAPGREDPAAALAEADRHLRRETADAGAMMYRGAAREMLGDVAAAEDDYRRALEANPAFGGASLRLAALLVRAGRMDEARGVLRSHLVRHPGDPLAEGLLSSL